jgi:protein TonB
MDFDTWTPSKVDTLRVKRLVLGYVVGAIAVVLTGALIFLSSPNASAKEDEEPEIEAQLAKEPEPEPEPEPPPPEPVEKPKPKPKIQIPVEIPKEAPKEAEPVQQQKDEPDPFEEKPAAPVETAKPAVVEAPKPPPRVVVEKPKGPTRVLEDDTPPEQISKTNPIQPASTIAAGIEGVVIVKYVVTETGAVTDVKVLKGPPELHDACLTAVKTWRFNPAKDVTGKVKAVTRIARFVFKLKT